MITVFDPSNGGTFTPFNPILGVVNSPASTVPVANAYGQASFIFYADVLGNVASIPLNGTFQGKYMNASRVVQVPDSFGINPNPPTPTTTGAPTPMPVNSGSSSSSNFNTGLFVALIVVFIVIAAVIVQVVRKQKRRNKPIKAAGVASAAAMASNPSESQMNKPNSTNTNTNTNTNKAGTNRSTGGLQPVTYEQHQRHFIPAMAQVGAVESKFTDVARGYPTYSQPQPQPYYPQQQQPQPQPQPATLTQPGGYPYATPTTASRSFHSVPSAHTPVQSVQAELQQQFNFSSHPRPNVVTTVGPQGSQGPDRSVAPLPQIPDVWEPKPFVPPVRNPSPLTGSPAGGPLSSSTSQMSGGATTTASYGYATGHGYGSTPAGGSSRSHGGVAGSVIGSGTGSLPASGTVVGDATNNGSSSFGSPHTTPSMSMASPPIPNHSRPT